MTVSQRLARGERRADRPMKVFVTGANGFIGRTLVERLRARGDQVSGVDLINDPTRDVVAGDITTPGEWQEHAGGADLVIHAAAIVSNAPDRDAQWRVNTLGTRRVLDAAVRAGAKRFLYISSVRAFSDVGFPDGVTEEYPVRPDGNPYVDTKIACEQVVLQAHAAGEIPGTIIRPGDVYGPGSRPWTVLPVEAIRKRQFVLPAMGNGVFSPIYIDDLIDGIVLAADSRQAAGQVFTLSGGVGVSCKEFFGYYSRMVGKRPLVLVPTTAAVAAAHAISIAAKVAGAETEVNATTMRYFTRTGTYSIDKARRVLGYEPQVSLADGMARTASWLADNNLL